VPKTVQVAIAFALSEPHQVRILRGIKAFAEQRGNWAFSFSPEQFGGSIAALRRWRGDGVFANITTRREARIAREMGIPVVNLSGALRKTGLPRVMVDQEAMGRMAADHLVQCGFRHFGFFGVRRVWSARQRKLGFIKRVNEAGCECSVLETPSSPRLLRSAQDWLKLLDRWLKSLRLPVGVMASIDLRGAMIIDACARLGLRVPADVAVIGVDDNEVICELCRVPLSSVSRSDLEVGYKAASLLSQMIGRKGRSTDEILIPPDRIVQRRSTDIVAVDNPEITAAAGYIQEHVDESFGIERLVQVSGRSRRWLTQHFRHCLSCTPYEYICLVRVERAKKLLSAGEKLPLYEIARRCGFSETRNLRHVFRRLTGTTPARYRRGSRQSQD
jgi:LacI family transcriptional regulator